MFCKVHATCCNHQASITQLLTEIEKLFSPIAIKLILLVTQLPGLLLVARTCQLHSCYDPWSIHPSLLAPSAHVSANRDALPARLLQAQAAHPYPKIAMENPAASHTQHIISISRLSGHES